MEVLTDFLRTQCSLASLTHSRNDFSPPYNSLSIWQLEYSWDISIAWLKLICALLNYPNQSEHLHLYWIDAAVTCASNCGPGLVWTLHIVRSCLMIILMGSPRPIVTPDTRRESFNYTQIAGYLAPGPPITSTTYRTHDGHNKSIFIMVSVLNDFRNMNQRSQPWARSLPRHGTRAGCSCRHRNTRRSWTRWTGRRSPSTEKRWAKGFYFR